MATPLPPTRRTSDVVLLVVLLAAVWTPLFAMIFHADDERRALAFERTSPAPGVPRTLGALKEWPNTFRRYFNAHFGFRAPLMRAHAALKLGVFDSTSSDQVMLGKDDWLFFSIEGMADDFRGLRPFNDAELSAWGAALQARRDWLRSRGIDYVFYVAPDSQTIYPEFMPSALTRVDAPTRLDQLTAYLRAHSDVSVVDVRPGLFAGKASDRLYFKTDTHWNQLGAFAAYRQLADRMQTVYPQWRADELADFDRVETNDFSGDLALFLATSRYRETRTDLVRRRPEVRGNASDQSVERPRVELETDDGELGTAVVFRDSFFAAQSEFVARHFRRSVLISTSGGFDPAVVEQERPTIVIQEFVERTLLGPAPSDPLPEVAVENARSR